VVPPSTTDPNGDLITCTANNDVYLAMDGGEPGFDANKHMAVTRVAVGCNATSGVTIRDDSDPGVPRLVRTTSGHFVSPAITSHAAAATTVTFTLTFSEGVELAAPNTTELQAFLAAEPQNCAGAVFGTTSDPATHTITCMKPASGKTVQIEPRTNDYRTLSDNTPIAANGDASFKLSFGEFAPALSGGKYARH
jgi:hypothetical protein